MLVVAGIVYSGCPVRLDLHAISDVPGQEATKNSFPDSLEVYGDYHASPSGTIEHLDSRALITSVSEKSPSLRRKRRAIEKLVFTARAIYISP